jgi:hypothetical protein
LNGVRIPPSSQRFKPLVFGSMEMFCKATGDGSELVLHHPVLVIVVQAVDHESGVPVSHVCLKISSELTPHPAELVVAMSTVSGLNRLEK